MTDEPKSQTTPETIVGGLDIFKFGPADTVGGPGAPAEEQATPAPSEGDHPGKAPEEKKEIAGGKNPPPEDKLSQPPPSRFKSHDEAERGYRELQGKTTQAEQAAAEARAAAEAARSEAAVLKTKLAEAEGRERKTLEAQSESARQAAVDTALEAFATERRASALKEIGALDPDDPEHDAKVASIWGRVDAAVLRFARHPVDKDGKSIEAAGAVETKPTAPPDVTAEKTPASTKETPPEPPPEEKQAADRRKTAVISYIDGKARAAGIDPETDELWWGVSRTTPSVDDKGQGMTIDQQIDWAINRYNERVAAIKAVARQNSELPLGGGSHLPGGPGGAPPAPSGTGSYSLDSAIARANESRRL